MLGKTISDTEQTESSGITQISGMGLLDTETVFREQKVQTQVKGSFHSIEGRLSVLNGLSYEGYEIHMGRSEGIQLPLFGGGNVYGSYIHGFFDVPGICGAVLKSICENKGVDFDTLGTFDLKKYKEQQYDMLADTVRAGLDMDYVYRVLNREV